jgi:hypothetical protein
MADKTKVEAGQKWAEYNSSGKITREAIITKVVPGSCSGVDNDGQSWGWWAGLSPEGYLEAWGSDWRFKEMDVRCHHDCCAGTKITGWAV